MILQEHSKRYAFSSHGRNAVTLYVFDATVLDDGCLQPHQKGTEKRCWVIVSDEGIGRYGYASYDAAKDAAIAMLKAKPAKPPENTTVRDGVEYATKPSLGDCFVLATGDVVDYANRYDDAPSALAACKVGQRPVSLRWARQEESLGKLRQARGELFVHVTPK